MCVNEGIVHSQYFLCSVRYFQVAAEISKSSGGYKTKQKNNNNRKTNTEKPVCVAKAALLDECSFLFQFILIFCPGSMKGKIFLVYFTYSKQF